jgi:hypothetical protein
MAFLRSKKISPEGQFALSFTLALGLVPALTVWLGKANQMSAAPPVYAMALRCARTPPRPSAQMFRYSGFSGVVGAAADFALRPAFSSLLRRSFSSSNSW